MSFDLGKLTTALRLFCSAFACLLILVIVSQANQISIKEGHSTGDWLEIEHAEFVLPSDAGQAIKGYVTIWNGTNRGLFLESVESPAFSSLSLFKTEFVDGVERSLPKQLAEIPARSELLMKTDGIHLIANKPTEQLFAGKRIELIFNFSGGRQLARTATVLAPGTGLADHHHGEPQDWTQK